MREAGADKAAFWRPAGLAFLCLRLLYTPAATNPAAGRYRDREGGAHHTTPPHPEMTGAQESRDTGAVPLDKGTRWGWSTCTFWSARRTSSCGLFVAMSNVGGRSSARRRGESPSHGQQVFSQDWGSGEQRSARGSAAFTRSGDQHSGMPPPSQGTPRSGGGTGNTPETSSAREAAARIEAAAGDFEHEFNVAMLANIGSQDIVALVKDLEVVHGEAVTRGMVMPSTEGPWTAVDVGKSVAYLDELSEQLNLTVAKDAPIDEGFFAPGASTSVGAGLRRPARSPRPRLRNSVLSLSRSPRKPAVPRPGFCRNKTG